jgi:sialic acid synthase SpsE
MALARQLVDAVASHADAVKFCKRHVGSDLTREAYERPYAGPNSFGPTYGRHREALELSIEQYAELKAYAEQRGLLFFATACDRHSVDELEQIGVELYKVASRDLTNLPLLAHLARTGKPLILSCGMDSLVEIGEAIETVRTVHNRLVLLQCTSAYPTPYHDVNLRVMSQLRERFDALVGLSDHTPGGTTAVVAAALGAVVVEKHVTIDRSLPGTDHAASLEVDEFSAMARDIRNMELALGDGIKRVPASVRSARDKLARVLVSAVPLRRGQRVTEAMLCLKSGGPGLSWRERGRIVGCIARCDIPADVVLKEADFAPIEKAQPVTACGLAAAPIS